MAVLTFRDGQSRAPLIPQYVQADATIAIDVRVVDAGGEVDFGWLEWVVCREVDGQEEDAALEWTVTLNTESVRSQCFDIDSQLTGPMMVACQ